MNAERRKDLVMTMRIGNVKGWTALALVMVAACAITFPDFEGGLSGGGGTSGAGGLGGSIAGVGAASTASTTTTSTGGMPNTCDGGKGCTVPSDCTLQSTACITNTCNMGCCGTANADAETMCTDNGTVCDGNGNCVACLKPTDCMASKGCDVTTNTCYTVPWVEHFGSLSVNTYLHALQQDALGNLYAAGYFSGGNLQLAGLPLLVNQGGLDIFIAKLTPAGTPIWVRTCASSADDVFSSSGFAVAPDGNVYIGGLTDGNMTCGTGPSLGAPVNPGNSFLASFTKDGDFRWAYRYDQPGGVNAITVDPDDVNLFVESDDSGAVVDYGCGGTCGSTSQGDLCTMRFSTGTGTCNAKHDIVCANGLAETSALATDASGNLYIAGVHSCSVGGLAIGSGALQQQHTCANDDHCAFVGALTRNLGETWGYLPDETVPHRAFEAVAVDSVHGTVAAVGWEGSAPSLYDVWVQLLDVSTGASHWQFPGSTGASQSEGLGVGFDAVGNVFVVGDFRGGSWTVPPTLTNGGTDAGLLLKLTASSGAASDAKGYDDGNVVYPGAIVVDASGNVLLGGSFSGTFTLDGVIMPATGAEDAFLGNIGQQ